MHVCVRVRAGVCVYIEGGSPPRNGHRAHIDRGNSMVRNFLLSPLFEDRALEDGVYENIYRCRGRRTGILMSLSVES